VEKNLGEQEMSANKNDPKWKKFEKVVCELLKIFNNNDADVKYDDKVIGIESGQERQIDIALRGQVNIFSLLVVVSCKDYTKSKVDLNDITEFASTLRDIRANKGVLITSGVFTKGAMDYAKNQGIEIYSLIDTKNLSWLVELPVLLERTYIKNYRFRLSGSTTTSLVIPKELLESNLMLAEFETDSGQKDFVKNIISDKWDSIKITIGETEVKVGMGQINYEGFSIKADLTVILNFAQKYYFGYIPIKTKGLYNQQSGGFTTKEVETEKIIPYEIEQGKVEGWIEIDNPETIAIKPVITTGYTDCLSRINK
jgi:hypothetical protein